MKTSPLAAVLAFVLAAVLGTALATPALAHTALKSSSPKKGATVETLDEVKLTFTESVKFPVVLVRDADGKPYHDGKPQTDGPVITQKVAAPLPSGKYTIAWRVVSTDGHPVEGEIPFTVSAPAPAIAETTPAATPAPTDSATPAPAGSPAPAPTATATATPPSEVTATPAADSTEQRGGIPAWAWIVVFGIAGIGIGLMISMRKKT
ncbi:copper resistance CopC family protein [Sphaerisporangium sp. B11E5]|uniref:copper resistance CopC family protein n=1 Tax=Sphaerisporangium sp. B11E5 TaxID=3153563 RepID=UPI00325F2420